MGNPAANFFAPAVTRVSYIPLDPTHDGGYLVRMLQGIRIKAVLIGVGVTWAVSALLGAAIGMWVVAEVEMLRPGQPPDLAEFERALKSDSMALAACLWGGLASLIPGFVTGWIARAHRVKNALVMSLLTAATSCVLLPLMHGYPAWYFPLCSAFSVVFCTVGGFLSDLAFGTKSAT
jgi:hypothetical protein